MMAGRSYIVLLLAFLVGSLAAGSSRMTRMEALQELRLSSKVGANLSMDDLKQAYRKRSLETHPDKPGGSQAAFVRVAQAYEVLSQSKGDGTAFGGNGFSFTFNGGTTQEQEDVDEAFRQAQELFKTFYHDLLEHDDSLQAWLDGLFDAPESMTAAERMVKSVLGFAARGLQNSVKQMVNDMEAAANGESNDRNNIVKTPAMQFKVNVERRDTGYSLDNHDVIDRAMVARQQRRRAQQGTRRSTNGTGQKQQPKQQRPVALGEHRRTQQVTRSAANRKRTKQAVRGVMKSQDE